MRYVVLALIFYIPASHTLNTRIIGGTEAALGQFPFIAGINVTGVLGVHFCGGTLISSLFVISSGFCVIGGQRFDVFLGVTNLKEPDSTILHAVSNVYVVHPEFNPNIIRNDIGFIRLPSEIQFTDYVKPIAFLSDTDVDDDSIVQTVGWGEINDLLQGPVEKLRWVYLTTLPNTECEEFYGNVVYEDMVCVSGNHNQGICHGDTGGPLILYDDVYGQVLAGVSSFLSANGCENTEPSGFTRLYHYREWIQNITGV